MESIVSSEPQEIVVPLEMQESLLSMTAEELAMVEELAMIPGLMERVHKCRRAREEAQAQIVEAPQVSSGLQDALDEVADQVPDDEDSSDEHALLSTFCSEGYGVGERSSRYRRPVVTCAGCTRTVHNQRCVRNVRLGTVFQMSMCHTCCIQVEDLVEEVEEYVDASNLVWDQDAW